MGRTYIGSRPAVLKVAISLELQHSKARKLGAHCHPVTLDVKAKERPPQSRSHTHTDIAETEQHNIHENQLGIQEDRMLAPLQSRKKFGRWDN